MGPKIVERRTGYNGCDRCPDYDNNVTPEAAGSYKLYGFCYKYAAWVTTLDEPDLHIIKCGIRNRNNAYRITKK